MAALLCPRSANASNSADHIAVLDLALAQFPHAVQESVLVHTDSGGGTKRFLAYIVDRQLQFSVGIGVNIGIDRELLARLPADAWTAAYVSNGQSRDGPQVAELTSLLPDLSDGGCRPCCGSPPAGNDPTSGPSCV